MLRWIGSVFFTCALCAPTVCQATNPGCDEKSQPRLIPCAPVVQNNGQLQASSRAFGQQVIAGGREGATGDDPRIRSEEFVVAPEAAPRQGFHWGRALLESFELLSVEQAYVVHDDWDWVGGSKSENGVPFNHYWRDYKQSLSAWVHSGWNDGDPNMYGYLGHPIQGLATSYIFLQNDPSARNLEFSKTKAYWKSRLKATVFNAVYSTQWNIGPLSEMTVEKYGTHWRSPWNSNGTWPCNTNHCYTGVGQIDLVMTPIGGAGWLIGEDILDRYITRRVEAATPSRLLIDVTRMGLDPVSAGTNMLHGKRPWYRSRDTERARINLRLRGNGGLGAAADSGGGSH